jgi:Shikimate kinase
MRRVTIIASASGNGKTTLGRELAARLGVPFVELDALVHGPGWVETPDEELRARVEPILAGDGWVVDGTYQRKLGTLVLDAADTVVWLDLPIRVWLRRLAVGRFGGWRDAKSSGTRTERRCGTRFGAGTRSSSGRCVRTSPAGGRGRMSSPATPWCGCARRAR